MAVPLMIFILLLALGSAIGYIFSALGQQTAGKL
jgi:hypothetical protein